MGGVTGEQGGGKKSQADSVLSVEPDGGLDLTVLGSGPEAKPRVGGLTDCVTQAPQGLHFKMKFKSILKTKRL